MYNKLKINVDNVLERLYEAVRYIDLTKIKLLDKKNANRFTVKEIDETIKENCNEYYSDGNNYFYNIKDAYVYYEYALNEVIKEIKK